MKKFVSKSAITKIQAILVAAVIVIAAVVAGGTYWYINQPKGGPESIILGADLGLSGPYASLNNEFQNVWNLVISEYNDQGGVYVKELGRRVPIELKYVLDNKGDPNTAVSDVEQLCTTYSVDFILGGAGTPLIRPSAPVADRNHKLYIDAGTAYLPLHQQGYRYVFTVFSSARGLTRPLIDFVSQLSPQPAVLAHWHDSGSLTTEIAKWARFLLPSTISYTEKVFPMGTQDFTAAIAEAKQANPPIDVLFMSFQLTTDLTTLWRQLQELDWSPKLFAFNVGPSAPDVVSTLGTNVNDRLLYLDLPQTKELYDVYQNVTQKYNPAYTPGQFTYWGYAQIKSLLLAIENAGSLDTDKVTDAMYNLKWTTPAGVVVQFDSVDYVGYADLDEPVVKFVPAYTIHGQATYVDKPVWPATAGVPGWEVVSFTYPIPGW